MTDALFKEKWIGHFTYGVGYPENFQSKKVDFSLDLKLKNGELTGTCYDSQVSPLMEGIITVNGFIEDDLISFIKQYPAYYSVNENDEVLIDRDQKHPTIHYYGTYDENASTLSGTWEIETEHPEFPFQYSLISLGSWEIKSV